MRNLTARVSFLLVFQILLLGGGASASDKEVVFRPPEGFTVLAGFIRIIFRGDLSFSVASLDVVVPKIAFSADGRFAFALATINTDPDVKRMLSFRRDSGELVDERDVGDILSSLSTMIFDPTTSQLALFGLGGEDIVTPEVLLIQVDSEGRFTKRTEGKLSPLPLGSSSISQFFPPSIFKSRGFIVQPFASHGLVGSITSLSVLDEESGALIGELDLRPAMPGNIGGIATNAQTNKVAVIIQSFDGAVPDIVAVCSISEAGIPQLDQVIRPEAGTVADLEFDPSGRFLFLVSQEANAKVLSADVSIGDVVQTRSLGLEVVQPSIGVDELQVNEVTRLVGVIGAKSLAFLQFDENGMLGEATLLDNDSRLDLEDSYFEFLPGGFHAVTLDFKKNNLLLVDTSSGNILDTIPIVFAIPASVAPDGSVAVTDFLTDAIHLYTFDLRPQIVFVEAKKKKINIFGARILEGAIVEIDGTAVPATLSKNQLMFIVKRSVAKGQTVMVEIVNPDGSRSGKVPVTR